MEKGEEKISDENFRAMILFAFKLGQNRTECFENLEKFFQDDSPSYATVSRWFKRFERKQWSLRDEPRSGRPIEVLTDKNIEMAAKLVKEDRRITIRQLAQELNVNYESVRTILHESLGLRKLTSRWIPHLLSDEQKQSRVSWCKFMLDKFDGGRSKLVSEIITADETWIYQYDPETKQQSTVWVFDDEVPPTKLVKSRSVGKRMMAVFFRRKGPVAIIPLVEQRTVTAAWYCEVALPKVFHELKDSRSKTGLQNLMLHHDNASSHTAFRTIDFLQQSGIQLLPHPPYSPDLAPCDFFLFPKVKSKIKGVRFESQESAVHAFESLVMSMSHSDYCSCFESWFYRMKLCIDSNGEYFEKF
jgi:[histone H3]-lysine36 N-dimethyltransferase SETMAR